MIQYCMIVHVRVHPSASKNALLKNDLGNYDLYTTAPAHEGKANKALIAQISNHFNTPKSHIHIIQGHRTKTKLVEIDV